MNEDHARKMAAGMLETFGMRVSLTSHWASRGMIWDGVTLHCGGENARREGVPSRQKLDAETMYHEAGHFLVAHERWKHVPEYGLGAAPFAAQWCGTPLFRNKGSDTQSEEDMAYIVGLRLAARAGFDIEPIVRQHHILVAGDGLLTRHDGEAFWHLMPSIRRLGLGRFFK